LFGWFGHYGAATDGFWAHVLFSDTQRYPVHYIDYPRGLAWTGCGRLQLISNYYLARILVIYTKDTYHYLNITSRSVHV